LPNESCSPTGSARSVDDAGAGFFEVPNGSTLLCRSRMHVLVLPKWYPGRNDPQLGDFVRKQMLAASAALASKGGRMSVVFGIPITDLERPEEQELDQEHGTWELRCYYRPSMAAFTPLRKLINMQRYWRASWNGIRRAIDERGKPDLTHVHILVRPALVAWWLKKMRGVPFILSEQSSEYLDGTWDTKSALFKAINHFLFRRAAAVTVVSTHLGEGLKRLGLCTHYEVVPNMVPGADRPLPPSGPSGQFMMVADLVDKTKNVSGVLRALKAGRDQGHDLRLDVIGDGTDVDPLRDLSKTLGLNGSVRWLGRMSNTEVLTNMAATGTVIINSNVETFSVVTGEALALGKPVIATRCGGPVAFITDENGVLIEPRDDGALTAAMISRATGQRSYDAATIRRTVDERFSARTVGEQFSAIYQRVIEHG
jgi:glycosyltransferase involved in cell wall biosynthesis